MDIASYKYSEARKVYGLQIAKCELAYMMLLVVWYLKSLIKIWSISLTKMKLKITRIVLLYSSCHLCYKAQRVKWTQKSVYTEHYKHGFIFQMQRGGTTQGLEADERQNFSSHKGHLLSVLWRKLQIQSNTEPELGGWYTHSGNTHLHWSYSEDKRNSLVCVSPQYHGITREGEQSRNENARYRAGYCDSREVDGFREGIAALKPGIYSYRKRHLKDSFIRY